MTKQVKIVRVQGYQAGEVVGLPDNRALTYCLNGQATPVGWSADREAGRSGKAPVNRMLDTGPKEAPAPLRRVTTKRTTKDKDDKEDSSK